MLGGLDQEFAKRPLQRMMMYRDDVNGATLVKNQQSSRERPIVRTDNKCEKNYFWPRVLN